MSMSPSSFQFGTVNSNGVDATASVTFTNTSGQTEQFSTTGYFGSGGGDTVTPTGCGNANLSYTTLSAGQACTVTVTLHVIDGSSGVVSPATPSAENFFAMVETVNIQGSSSGDFFYVPFYATLAPGGGSSTCPSGDTGTANIQVPV
jgi:hypothetical protein